MLSGSYVPFDEQYHSCATPSKLLRRILAAGVDIRCDGVRIERADARSLVIEKKILYWHEQACRHRVGQPARQYFIDLLEKQACFHERKQAAQQAQEAAVWTPFWQEQDRRASYQLALWRKHQQMREAQQAAARKRKVEEANRKEAAKARRQDRCEAATVVAAPPVMSRNVFGDATSICLA